MSHRLSVLIAWCTALFITDRLQYSHLVSSREPDLLWLKGSLIYLALCRIVLNSEFLAYNLDTFLRTGNISFVLLPMSLTRFSGSVNSLDTAFLASSVAHSLRHRMETVMGVR